MSIEPTRYYDNFLKYFELAKKQQEDCNLGFVSHQDWDGGDELMCKVELYDVVERKYAGFSQLMNDVFYGYNEDHPYWPKMQKGMMSPQRNVVSRAVSYTHLTLPTNREV